MKEIKEVIPAFQKAYVIDNDHQQRYIVHAWAHQVDTELNEDHGYLPMINSPSVTGLVTAEDEFSYKYSIHDADNE